MKPNNLQNSIYKSSPTGYVVMHLNAPFFSFEEVINHNVNLRTQEIIKSIEQRFKSLIKEGSDLIAILDPEGTYQYVNPTSKSILGMEAHFFIGKNAFDFIHPDDKEIVMQQFSLSMEQRQVNLLPFRFKISNGEFRWIETTITNMIDEPSIGGIVANSKDITLRVEHELKAEESIDRYNILSKATNEAIWDWNILSGKVIWNKGIKGIFGFEKTLYNHSWWADKIHPDDMETVLRDIQLLIETKKSKLKTEYRFRCADGSYKNVLDRGFLMFNKAGEPIRMIGSMQDITDRINYVGAIEKQNVRLREISWIQSHDVRAPLARILGLSDLLFDNIRDETTKEILSHLIKSAAELDDVIRNIIKKTEAK